MLAAQHYIFIFVVSASNRRPAALTCGLRRAGERAMDILHLFAQSPLHPAYDTRRSNPASGRRGKYLTLPGALTEIGHRAARIPRDAQHGDLISTDVAKRLDAFVASRG